MFSKKQKQSVRESNCGIRQAIFTSFRIKNERRNLKKRDKRTATIGREAAHK